jgi:hypothetical protein
MLILVLYYYCKICYYPYLCTDAVYTTLVWCIFRIHNKQTYLQISLFHRAFQFTIYNGPTNELVCNKTLIQMSHTKTLKITPCIDHQMIIIRELFDPG